MCKIYNKILNSTNDIDLKSFIFDYKKLRKQLKLQEIKEKRKETLNKSKEKKANTNQSTNNLLELNRQMRQDKIKKVLKDSILLKIQLKSQLKALREKEIIDKEIIDSNIRISNLQIEDI